MMEALNQCNIFILMSVIFSLDWISSSLSRPASLSFFWRPRSVSFSRIWKQAAENKNLSLSSLSFPLSLFLSLCLSLLFFFSLSLYSSTYFTERLIFHLKDTDSWMKLYLLTIISSLPYRDSITFYTPGIYINQVTSPSRPVSILQSRHGCGGEKWKYSWC